MIVVHLTGGLGNQMFQYAVGKACAVRHNVDLLIDTSWYAKQGLREFELSCFNHTAQIASEDILQRVVNPKLRPLLAFSKRVGLFTSRIPLFMEPHFHYCTRLETLSPPSYLIGSWQSERYFEVVTTELRTDFSFKESPDPVNNAMLGQIASVDNSVAIHIRRGDYVSNKETNVAHGTCPPRYYAKAVKRIADHTKSPHFFVFSDDIAWAKDNFNVASHPMTMIDVNDASRGHCDMMLMSACKHHIIANSSFSWWGAWLGTDKESIVCAPELWFANQAHNTNDIIPKRWDQL